MNLVQKILIGVAILSLFASSSYSQIDSLKNKIEQIIKTKDATVGVSICGIENKDGLNINSEMHFPMQSVFKFHIALAVLNQVDKGKLKLDKEIFISKKELLPNTWSPIREAYPEGNVKLKLSEIILLSVESFHIEKQSSDSNIIFHSSQGKHYETNHSRIITHLRRHNVTVFDCI